ncbi:uncharacterized protein LOC112460398 isoform X1 [Temnothorax curvispinosus]|uniref:Uncharacterized protein LOC112460398 isoform X1 n=1 Tax=Temnothorax curvispinosus TaxID=300111 RepID=A0A6J1QHZ6_9HYME|nr:uncharacterized protein LOC112460398 isoform X1 [Temnothorax curvispinosus]XP_024880820.1 uncharacterized protein LOC112460398 isoform X1 [Temnothorax curvispinosus]XP_024880821.1 uncharacterized protein LOC112460398 isoform X1 [Temnothorax curvispinosus]
MTKQSREHYLQVLTQLEKAVSENNLDSLKKLSNLIDNISNAEDQITLRDYYDSASNSVKSTNLVILACKHNKVKILEYLFDSDSKILNNLSVVIGRNTILPGDKDETCHNAFYYAIRSCNIELLDTLISKWPGNYFAVYLGELDTILSRAYEELKLKNVPLSDEIEIFVENKLVNLRFFSNISRKDKKVQKCVNIRERIELTLQNINLLKTDYSNAEKADKRALFVAKSIAQNIHILKRQLKSTYDILPWEEMEFCLVSFVSSHTKRQEINLFYNATLNKSKILNHLENFAKKLEDIKDNIGSVNIDKFADFPKLKREKVVAEIISSYPQFEELYDDYQQIRDIHSLMKISDNIKLALSVDPKKREGQLIITRVLQVIGEHLKNTLESPKLSNDTSELLLLSLPKNTRQIIIDLRNSLSHAYSLSKRTEIEENTDGSFFIGVQNDTKRIDIVITDILYSKKIKTLRMLLKRIADSESLGEIKEIAEIFSNVKLDEIIQENFKMMEHEKFEKLIKELSDNITDKTNYEEELFNEINNIISCAETLSENIQIDYITGHKLIKFLISLSENLNFDGNYDFREIKDFVNQILENMTLKIKPHSLNEISKLVMKIFRSVRSRIRDDELARVNTLICKIFFYIPEFGTSNIRWIKKLRGMLNENGSFISTYKQRKTYDITEEEYNKLTLKLSELKSILSNNGLSDQLIEKLPSFKNDQKLQTLVEMLVLDIMSILGSSGHYLENNLLSLDDNTPLLTGKCLRNHLAHDNPLVDVMLSDPSIAVVLNAKKLTEGNIIKTKKKIGKLISDNSFKVKEKFDQDLDTITNQERMFAALEEGNLESLKDCLKRGADINARSVDSWTTLHFAVKGPSLEVVKFILDKNLSVDVKDINGQSLLHIAAAHGRKNIVEFFVKAGLCVNELDKVDRTPLHVAAQYGHEDIIKFLLKNKANISAQDKNGFPPLHYAIHNNHINVTKILLKKDRNVDINETIGGLAPLHAATKRGHLELVNFLLQNKTDVNVRNDEDWTPLHIAALYGHLEIVNALIFKRADINAREINGWTPLHHAVENGHKLIVNILLKHGANVNAVNKFHNSTPLLFAAKDGHEEIVKALLKNKADASIATITGYTPLHIAAQNGHLGIVVALLKHGVDICARAHHNFTPLYCSAVGGHKEVAEVLIKNGAKVNETTTDFTPLHAAAMRGHRDIINLLIKNKANVNAKSFGGMTPLHAAVLNGCVDIIDLLIKSQAEIEANSYDGIDLVIKDITFKVTSKVKAKFYSGMTPLHLATLNGREDIIGFLIKYRAKVNTRAFNGFTPLHTAVVEGHKGIVNLLIKNKAQIDARDFAGNTPLHKAVQAGNKEIVEILAVNGANVNVKSDDNMTPLLSAIQCNYREIVEVLIASGANVNAEGIESLSLLAGYSDIAEILLEKTYVDMKDSEIADLLYLTAGKGHNALIAREADVDAITYNNLPPLCFAAQKGYEKIVQILIAGGANVNVKSTENVTPLHLAAVNGHDNVVKVLLDNKANINVKNNDNRTPDELAVARGHLQVVKLLMQCEKIDIVFKRNDDYTILHIASEESNLEMIKYLVDKGSDVNAKNASGSKPIHIAAREGYKDTVEFFLSKGLSINDRGEFNQTLLHFAAMKGHLEVAKYLISQGADVNAKDANNGLTPMHVAANFGYVDFIEVLLKNGAVYNAVDNSFTRPLEMSDDESVISLLTVTEKLFKAVKRNGFSEVENYIKAGAVVNAKNINGTSLLHYAAWKGYDKIVDILLQNKADPNAVNNKGFTPLHYAAKFSHLKVVKLLLSNGAVYNAVSDDGKTPSDFTVDKSITSLFKLLSDSFKHVKNDNFQVINDLNKIKDIDTVRAIMNACDREYKTLVVAAVHSNFSKVELLKDVSQIDASIQFKMGLLLLNQGDNQGALSLFKSSYEKRKEILGSDNPGTLDIQKYIGKVSYTQEAYQEALNTFEEIFQKQKEILGLNDKNTLHTRSTIALVLYRLGRNEEAFNIYQEVCPKQEELLGPNHSDTLETYCHMAIVLEKQGKHEEALNINRTVLERNKEIHGANHQNEVCIENNIAGILIDQGKLEEALKLFKEVYEKKKVIFGINNSYTLGTLQNIAATFWHQKKFNEALKTFQEVFDIQKRVLGPNNPNTLQTQYSMANVLFDHGKCIDEILVAQGKFEEALKLYKEVYEKTKVVFGVNHSSTLGTLQNIAVTLCHQEKFHEALKAFQEVFNIQINVLGRNNPNTLHTQYNIAKVLFEQGKWIGALQTFKECFNQLKAIFGPSHPTVLDILKKIKHIKIVLKFIDDDRSEILEYLQKDINIAASNGNIQAIRRLLKGGVDVNDKDIDGRTPLHYAVNSGQVSVVNILLENGADVTRVTNKGNTPLHTATFKGYKEFVEVLLQHVSHDKLNNFINAKTAASGATSLHVAAKNGFLAITKSLLKRGAIYNIKNNEGKTPLDLSKDRNVNDLLKLVEEMFKDAKNGNLEIISKLKAVKPDEFVVVTNARNNQGNTLLQVAVANRHKNVASKLLKMLTVTNAK